MDHDLNLDNCTDSELAAVIADRDIPLCLRRYAYVRQQARQQRAAGRIEAAMQSERQLDAMYIALPHLLCTW